MRSEITLDIVMYRDPTTFGDYWVAHCVQLDLVSSRVKPDDAWRDSMRQCAAQIAYAREKHLTDNFFRSPSAELMGMMARGDRKTVAPTMSPDGQITFNRVVFSGNIR